jgi:hypothetical protein
MEVRMDSDKNVKASNSIVNMFAFRRKKEKEVEAERDPHLEDFLSNFSTEDLLDLSGMLSQFREEESFTEEEIEEIPRDDLIKLSTTIDHSMDIIDNFFGLRSVIAYDDLWQEVITIRKCLLRMKEWTEERLS